MDIDTKLARSMCVLMTINKYKTDLSKLHDFISLNRSYFPEVTDEFLNKLKSGTHVEYIEDREYAEKIPKFVELNYERNSRNRKGRS